MVKNVYKQILSCCCCSLQSCPTLCDPIDGSPPGSPVPGILQARTLEWGAISFSNAWKWKVKVKLLSRVWLFASPWTAAYQAPPSMGFSRQVYWSRVPLPSPDIEQEYPFLWTGKIGRKPNCGELTYFYSWFFHCLPSTSILEINWRESTMKCCFLEMIMKAFITAIPLRA